MRAPAHPMARPVPIAMRARTRDLGGPVCPAMHAGDIEGDNGCQGGCAGSKEVRKASCETIYGQTGLLATSVVRGTGALPATTASSSAKFGTSSSNQDACFEGS